MFGVCAIFFKCFRNVSQMFLKRFSNIFEDSLSVRHLSSESLWLSSCQPIIFSFKTSNSSFSNDTFPSCVYYNQTSNSYRTAFETKLKKVRFDFKVA